MQMKTCNNILAMNDILSLVMHMVYNHTSPSECCIIRLVSRRFARGILALRLNPSATTEVVLFLLVHSFIGKLVNLEELNLSGCFQVKTLPESFCRLGNLKKLNLRGDGYNMKLESLPERFGQLRSLVELNLFGCNKLRALPEGSLPRILFLCRPGHLGINWMWH